MERHTEPNKGSIKGTGVRTANKQTRTVVKTRKWGGGASVPIERDLKSFCFILFYF